MPTATKRRPAKRTAKRAPSRTPRSIAAESLFDPGEALSGYDETYLTCRDLRHKWEVVGYFESGGYINRRLACDRCPTTRTDRLRRDGQREHPLYSYPDDYKIAGKVSARDVVAEQLNRVTIFGNEDQLMQSMFTNGHKRRR